MYKLSNMPQTIESKKAITDAFLKLFNKNKYNDITISKICYKAQVSRITFYRNFEAKDDIIRYYFDSIKFSFTKPNYENKDNLKNLLNEYFKYLYNYKDFISLIIDNNLDYLLKEVMLKSLNSLDLSNFSIYKNDENIDFAFDFIASTLLSVISLWSKHNFKENTNYLSNLTYTFLIGIIK